MNFVFSRYLALIISSFAIVSCRFEEDEKEPEITPEQNEVIQKMSESYQK